MLDKTSLAPLSIVKTFLYLMAWPQGQIAHKGQADPLNEVWVEIKSWLGFSRALTTLKAAAKWIIKEARGTGDQVVAKKVGFACTVYCIWATRNARIFEGKITHSTGIIRDIKIQVYRVESYDRVVFLLLICVI